jgi:hypothetical protein
MQNIFSSHPELKPVIIFRLKVKRYIVKRLINKSIRIRSSKQENRKDSFAKQKHIYSNRNNSNSRLLKLHRNPQNHANKQKVRWSFKCGVRRLKRFRQEETL